MALTRIDKNEVVAEVAELLKNSKLTVVAQYQGTTVKAIQALRKEAKVKGTSVKVVKNRLAIKAIQQTDNLKDTDTTALKGMLLYAFNATDEIAPAQTLHAFAKTEPSIQFVGAITAEGKFISVEEVKALAVLPSREQLIAGIINTLQSPVNNVMSGLKGNLHGLLDAIASKATN